MALICAGLFMASGNRRQDIIEISIGLLLGDLWAYIAIRVMETQQWNPDVELYITLFVMGDLTVVIGETFSRVVFTPSWPYDQVIGLTIIGPTKVNEIGTLSIRTGVTMLAGVIYVGVGADASQEMLVHRPVRGDALER